jgi:hypothetical protein
MKAKQNATTLTNRRRFLRLAGATATATALMGGAAVAATAPTVTDPCLVIAAERDRLKAIHETLLARATAIWDAQTKPMAGGGWPRVDRSLAIFKGTSFADGYSVTRYEIEHVILFREKDREALLRWWDDTRADMERRAIESGYRRACEESEAACAAMIDKECELVEVQATTIAGAMVKLEAAVNPDCLEMDCAYQRMLWGAVQDLKRLTAGGKS